MESWPTLKLGSHYLPLLGSRFHLVYLYFPIFSFIYLYLPTFSLICPYWIIFTLNFPNLDDICHIHPTYIYIPLVRLHLWAKFKNNQKTRRLCVLANTKLYHRNLLLWISRKFWILVSTTLGLFFQKIHLFTPIHIQLTKIKIAQNHSSSP